MDKLMGGKNHVVISSWLLKINLYAMLQFSKFFPKKYQQLKHNNRLI
jgi:hypothetical protein